MKEIQKKYNNVVQEYTDLFIEKYFNDGESTLDELKNETYWVANDVGTVFFIGDYFFNFYDIKYCIDNEVDGKQLFSWYNYRIDVGLIDSEIKVPNLQSWVKGCPRLSDKEISELNVKKQRIDALKKEIKEMIINK